jgi:hypothetical protein
VTPNGQLTSVMVHQSVGPGGTRSYTFIRMNGVTCRISDQFCQGQSKPTAGEASGGHDSEGMGTQRKLGIQRFRDAWLGEWGSRHGGGTRDEGPLTGMSDPGESNKGSNTLKSATMHAVPTDCPRETTKSFLAK